MNIMTTSEIDLRSREFRANPYPAYTLLRQHTPIVFRDELGMWVVSRHRDVATILRDRRFGRSIDHILTREQRGVPPKPQHRRAFDMLSENSMFDKEPPDHTRLRGLVQKAFTPRRIESLRAFVQRVADDLLDQVETAGTMDILADFAVPLPVTVIAELLGVPDSAHDSLRNWSQSIVAMFELEPTAEQERVAIQAAAEFADYLREAAAYRRQHPQDDLISALVEAEEAGERLTEDELIATCVLLLNAGHEATVNLVGNGLYALFRNPEQLRLLQENPSLNTSAVEEMLRYDTPLQLFRRFALEDVQFGGVIFRQGDEIALLFGSANRDPESFTDPDTLNIARADNPHISFSLGVHYCLGAPLARMELQIAFATLIRRFPKLALAREPQYRDSVVIRGLHSLEVVF
ncbi:MAG: cytochrome P450 [Anaerolineae bacterium]|nr:cytochrome P450 [Anaerolineae bacterium]